ncbi:Carboxylate--amine ligase [Glutamicibacter creatinolyticus]|uniref:Carboxylate--amine ligase n=1 Tax=Glutamicibacter creatinolyticus TaxID=162496 RepID=A0A5B7WV11_9MICC|nr:PAC2 family protein [Glutamicibacter creatinolyticus]QCY47135.1 Carboxylate--amine ligase [Glutamicibacter creatinolyticus]
MSTQNPRPTLTGFAARGGQQGRNSVLVCAFEGWNDAGSAASDAVRLILNTAEPEYLGTVGEDEYYDYQFTRPEVSREGGVRSIQWPQTDVYRIELPQAPADLLVALGVEPTYRWQAFCRELHQLTSPHRVAACLSVGSLLADVPHTRPVPVLVNSDDPLLQEHLSIGASKYEGPTGIPAVLGMIFERLGTPSLSVWAQQPHYVAQAPSPKVQLALVEVLEELLATHFPADQLRDDALAWQRGVDELASADPEVATYVQQLERATDASELPEASGESIAREFERYLKRRDRGYGGSGPDFEI